MQDPFQESLHHQRLNGVRPEDRGYFFQASSALEQRQRWGGGLRALCPRPLRGQIDNHEGAIPSGRPQQLGQEQIHLAGSLPILAEQTRNREPVAHVELIRVGAPIHRLKTLPRYIRAIEDLLNLLIP
ncbi:hypothetical protein HRbin22_01960 [Candidatus Thermoflexus japonica]|uniref:Uncharacterized protein n=1 Tax=Candidatus Thermoflexus japonica TaxID=2035417 RepID=A0A2H5Y8F0_9CHLR|nr:hypothetical protein HRbin22_01960 [Candidatus Thermoflexus japonica]